MNDERRRVRWLPISFAALGLVAMFACFDLMERGKNLNPVWPIVKDHPQLCSRPSFGGGAKSPNGDYMARTAAVTCLGVLDETLIFVAKLDSPGAEPRDSDWVRVAEVEGSQYVSFAWQGDHILNVGYNSHLHSSLPKCGDVTVQYVPGVSFDSVTL